MLVDSFTMHKVAFSTGGASKKMESLNPLVYVWHQVLNWLGMVPETLRYIKYDFLGGKKPTQTNSPQVERS